MPPSTSTATNLELRDYLSILRRRKALIALVVGLVVLASVAWSLTRTPQYRASAQVLITAREFEVMTGRTPADDADAVRAEIQFMSGRQMRRAITDNLGYLPEPSFRSSPSTSPGVIVSVTSTDAERAAKEANDFANAYATERRALVVEDIDASIAELDARLQRIIVDVTEDQGRLEELLVQLDQETDVSKQRLLTAQIEQITNRIDPNNVNSRRNTIQAERDGLVARQDSISGGGRFTVVEANVPQRPFSPQPARNASVALIAGLALGLVAAFTRDYFDDTLRTKEDLDAITGGIPVLGIIPAIDEWRDRKTALLEAVSHPNSAASEAYRSLRTAIDFISVDNKIDILHVTSSTSGEGKSTTSANLAVTLARAGKRVILIDCDLRRPRLHEFFGLDNGVGFTSVVLGSTRIEDALEPVAGVPGLLVLPSGPPPPNPSELLSTKTVQSKLEALSRSADFVVIDSPPLLPVSDSVVIAGLADLTLLVVTARTTATRSVLRSVEMLEQVNAPLGGIVFNGVGHEGTYGYGYGYGYTAYAPRSGRAAAAAKTASTARLPDEAPPTNGAGPVTSTNGSNGHAAEVSRRH
ncbi:MAG: polysaccharide biosynthesis tyrosine autokinase [Acidimicrobiales bacterium]|nr:polysaccharide biosynthesis tyrosine autokinase [Acidimicrobiales bacterium]